MFLLKKKKLQILKCNASLRDTPKKYDPIERKQGANRSANNLAYPTDDVYEKVIEHK